MSKDKTVLLHLSGNISCSRARRAELYSGIAVFLPISLVMPCVQSFNFRKAWLLLFAAVLFSPGQALAKYTVCTITINSDNEAKAFKSKLKPSQFDFVEIVPGQEKSKSDVEEGWFGQACGQLKSEHKKCDVVVISGHFGGTFFGSSGKRLSLETLEQMGCNDACPGIMSDPKEVFMFGCNTLAGKGKDTRTPEQYRAVLRSERNEGGDRVFTDAQIDEIVAFRYSEFGHSNHDRMSRAFSQVPHLYGFDSYAPLGRDTESHLKRYLDSVSDYAEHLREIEATRAAKLAQSGLDRVQRINNAQIAPNPNFTAAFQGTNFAQCSGAAGEDSDQFCSLFDPKLTLTTRLASLKKLLLGPDGTKYLALAKQFFETNPPEKYDPSAKAVFEEIRQDQTVKERYATTLAALRTMPVLGLNLIDLGEKLSFLSSREANAERQKVVIAAINSRTVEAKDMVCSRREWPEIRASDLKPEVFSNTNALQAISCLSILPTGIGDKKIEALLMRDLTDKSADTRRLAAWLLGMTENTAPATQQAFFKMIQDKDEWVRRMAAWALHRSQPELPEMQKRIAEMLVKEKDPLIRRDLVLALTYAQAPIPEVKAAFEKMRSDSDSIVRGLSAHAAERLARGLDKIDSKKEETSQLTTASNQACSAVNTEAKDTTLSCKTSKGGSFVRVKDPSTGEYGWKDLSTKLVWFDAATTGITQYEAELGCRDKVGQHLPSKEEYYVAEQNGIREVQKDMQHKWWRSSSVHPYNSYYAFGLYGDNGVHRLRQSQLRLRR